MKLRREYGFDNIRCILIFLVVFAHFLEPYTAKNPLYRMIYTFHMPVFAFISGWLGHFRPRSLLCSAGIYFLFQLLYRAMECALLGTGFKPDLLTPYWILWYLPFLIFCRLLLPLLDRYPRFPFWGVSILLSLAAGLVPAIGYPLTLSRFFVFLPYFILGHTLRTRKFRFPGKLLWFPTCAAALLSLCFALGDIPVRAFYGASAYFPGYGPLLRAGLYLPGTAWCFVFLALAQQWTAKLPWISRIGGSTLPVYLLHGFAVKLIARFAPLPPYPGSILPALALSAASLAAFSLPGRIRKAC